MGAATVAPTSVMSDAEVFAAQDRVADLVGVANAATAALCGEVADLIARHGWAADWCGELRSPEHYVAWRTGFSPRHASRITTIARRWGELPACQALFAAGAIGEDTMALIAQLVPTERDAEVATVARVMTYAQLSKLCHNVPKEPEPAPDREPTVVFGHDEGTHQFTLRATTDHDTGALVTRALEAARDDLFHQRHPDAAEAAVARTGVTWSDALAHVAEMALRALDPAARDGGRPSDRYQVFLHLDARQPAPLATLHLGPAIRDALARYLTCDATVSPVLHDGPHLVGIFPKERTVNDRLRRQIEQRDHGCRYPGCTQVRWVQVHHLRHWEDGGATTPDNLCALCPLHHRMHHAGLIEIGGDPEEPDGLTFHDRHGRPLRPPGVTPPAHPPDRPPPHLDLPCPHFENPDGRAMTWHLWDWHDHPSNSC